MGLWDDLSLWGVERVERSLGDDATAMRALIALTDRLPAGPARRRALVRAMELASRLADETSLDVLSARWSVLARDAAAGELDELCRELVQRAAYAHACIVAQADVDRTDGRDGRAHYLVGLCLEAAGAFVDARLAYTRARIHYGAGRGARAAEARELAMRALDPATRDDAAERAAALLERGGGSSTLELARVALLAGSRFRAAAALDALETIAREDPAARARAARIAAAHVDRRGDALDPLEAERAETILASLGARGRLAVERLSALRAFAAGAVGAASLAAETDEAVRALHERVRAMRMGGHPGPRLAREDRAALGWVGLAAIDAIEGEHALEAGRYLDEAARRVRGGEPALVPLWTAAQRAVLWAETVERGARLLEALCAANGEPPPDGFAAVADAVGSAVSLELAGALLRRAAERRERGARARLAELLRHAGWVAAREGRGEAARALLTEAKHHAGRAPASPSR